MIKIVIKKTPSVRLFDRMPMPNRIRTVKINRRALNSFQTHPFQRKVTKIS